MLRQILSTAGTAALLTAALSAAPAFSDDYAQLRDQVRNELAQHNIKVDNLDALGVTELNQIQLVFSTTESASAHGAQIEKILSTNGECVGNEQMRASVASQLSQHNIRIENFDAMTGSQVAILQAVLNSNEPTESMAAQIERIFASKSPILGSDQTRADAESCVRRVGADVNLKALSPEEMLQVQLIAGGSDSADEKRAQIEALGND